jgi:hypothetical protein
MSKTNKELQDALAVMTADRDSERAEKQAILDNMKDNRQFALKITRSDGQSNNRTIIGVIDGKVFHAQCVFRNKHEFIATEQFITGHNEALERKDVQEFLAEKERCDLLATQKKVAPQGDVPSAS